MPFDILDQFKKARNIISGRRLRQRRAYQPRQGLAPGAEASIGKNKKARIMSELSVEHLEDAIQAKRGVRNAISAENLTDVLPGRWSGKFDDDFNFTKNSLGKYEAIKVNIEGGHPFYGYTGDAPHSVEDLLGYTAEYKKIQKEVNEKKRLPPREDLERRLSGSFRFADPTYGNLRATWHNLRQDHYPQSVAPPPQGYSEYDLTFNDDILRHEIKQELTAKRTKREGDEYAKRYEEAEKEGKTDVVFWGDGLSTGSLADNFAETASSTILSRAGEKVFSPHLDWKAYDAYVHIADNLPVFSMIKGPKGKPLFVKGKLGKEIKQAASTVEIYQSAMLALTQTKRSGVMPMDIKFMMLSYQKEPEDISKRTDGLFLGHSVSDKEMLLEEMGSGRLVLFNPEKLELRPFSMDALKSQATLGGLPFLAKNPRTNVRLRTAENIAKKLGISKLDNKFISDLTANYTKDFSYKELSKEITDSLIKQANSGGTVDYKALEKVLGSAADSIKKIKDDAELAIKKGENPTEQLLTEEQYKKVSNAVSSLTKSELKITETLTSRRTTTMSGFVSTLGLNKRQKPPVAPKPRRPKAPSDQPIASSSKTLRRQEALDLAPSPLRRQPAFKRPRGIERSPGIVNEIEPGPLLGTLPPAASRDSFFSSLPIVPSADPLTMVDSNNAAAMADAFVSKKPRKSTNPFLDDTEDDIEDDNIMSPRKFAEETETPMPYDPVANEWAKSHHVQTGIEEPIYDVPRVRPVKDNIRLFENMSVHHAPSMNKSTAPNPLEDASLPQPEMLAEMAEEAAPIDELLTLSNPLPPQAGPNDPYVTPVDSLLPFPNPGSLEPKKLQAKIEAQLNETVQLRERANIRLAEVRSKGKPESSSSSGSSSSYESVWEEPLRSASEYSEYLEGARENSSETLVSLFNRQVKAQKKLDDINSFLAGKYPESEIVPVDRARKFIKLNAQKRKNLNEHYRMIEQKLSAAEIMVKEKEDFEALILLIVQNESNLAAIAGEKFDPVKAKAKAEERARKKYEIKALVPPSQEGTTKAELERESLRQERRKILNEISSNQKFTDKYSAIIRKSELEEELKNIGLSIDSLSRPTAADKEEALDD
ncbi:MAG: hypothetical protein JAY72_20480, partial [Candidatus Thiodiazotropha endolucinida]|nr:hypothetical protein [Candidatus Thiodiazotropha taylori]MCW4324059.1 hypothetical protein [Candidatus Thiodiazotropha taylori]